MRTVSAFNRTDLGSTRAAAQAAMAAIGGVIVVGSALWFGVIFAIMPRSESGFAEGLALLLGALWILVGFVVLAVGLWIPQRPGEGIHFSSRQRLLLEYGAIAPIVGVLGIPVGATLLPPLSAAVTNGLVAALVLLLVSGPIMTLLAVGLKIRASGE